MKNQMVPLQSYRTWKKYCGFFSLSTEQFTEIQERLLLQQLQRIKGSSVSEKIIGRNIPGSVDEFRHSVPLTTYEDYQPELEYGNENFLPEKPYIWAHTTRSSGIYKKVPYTYEFYNSILNDLMTAFIMACSTERGSSSIADGDRVLFNVAPQPYLSGILASGASERFNLRPIMTPDIHDGMDFKEKMVKGFKIALKTGVDILVAMNSVLVKMGNDFSQLSSSGQKSKHFSHPNESLRLAGAYIKSKLEKRSILPKDLWPVKAIIGWGIDTNIYRDLVHQYWGTYPFELHACTEAGIIAMQSWSKKDLTFIPYSNFFEFIPEAEWLKGKRDYFYHPGTVLLSEVKPGEHYELVITSFYRMPFIRYRLGHLIKVTALEDKQAGVYLPQMTFETRTDDLIDIAGFTRISENTIARAIANVGLNHEDWSVRKEIDRDKPMIHLYIEANNGCLPGDMASALHSELKRLDQGYHDLNCMIESHPLELTVLRPGTFNDYYIAKKERGAELHLRKPPRMNASDEIIEELIHLSGKKETSAV